MKATEQKIILYDSPEAAKPHRLEKDGWATPDGHWYENEDIARYHGCTHKRCECGGIMSKGYTKCEKCREKIESEAYLKLEFKEWDGKTPLAIYQSDEYFFDEDQLFDYCEENEITSSELQLVICRPNYLRQLDYDLWCDDLGEEQELPEELASMITQINEYCETHSINWIPSEYRTIVTLP